MKYIADTLTAVRLVLAIVVPVLVLQQIWLGALLLFAIAALSDALDGMAARRWPYSSADEKRLPWRRIDPHLLDNLPDSVLSIGSMLALAVVYVHWRWIDALLMGVSTGFIVLVQLLVRSGRVRAAECTDVVFGWWFALTLLAITLQLAYSAGWLLPVCAVLSLAAWPLLRLKWDRATTRPATREAAKANLRH